MLLSKQNKSLLLSLLVASIGSIESFAPSSTRIGITSVQQQTQINQNAFQHTTINSLPTSSSSQLSALSFLDEETTQKLIVLSFEKLIDAGIPSIFFIITSWWFISQFRNQDGGNGSMGMRSGRGSGRGNMGRRGGRGGRMSMGFDPNERPLGPVEELYDDIYDDLSGPQQDVPPLLKLLGGGGGSGRGGPSNLNNMNKPTSKLNIGIPKQQYLKVTKLNNKYDSYRYSMVKATKGKALAASELRGKGFDTAFYRALGITSSDGSLYGLTQGEGTALLKLERDFLSTGSELVKTVAELSREITNAAVLEEMQEMGVEAGVLDAIIVTDDEDVEVTDAQKDFFAIEESKDEKKKDEKTKEKKQSTDIMKAVKELEAINTDILLLELDFIQSVVDVLGPNRADAIRTTVVGNMINGEAGMLLKTLKERPLATVLSSFNGESSDNHQALGQKKNLYVTRFPGDVTASQLNELREEVTGILSSAQPGDEALLVLQSGGGTVTGYGLAAAQLQRFKAKGIKLTVCVEQVAASGGYMMCCTADKIVASPFAVLGSIGVISEVPNAYERLKQEGIEFQTITAGKFKRTVTPTKKITKEDLKKSTEDIQEIFNLFKGFVKSQRPQLDIEDVATGDTWFGEDALEKGLCDEIATADDVLLDFVDKGYDLYEVAYVPPPEGVPSLLTGLPGSSTNQASIEAAGVGGWRGVFRSMVRGVVSDVKGEVMAELSSSMNDMNSVERRYMAKDDSADRIR